MDNKTVMFANLVLAKTKLKNVQRILQKNNKVLNRLKQFITDNIYYFGEYCVHYLSTDKFDTRYALALVDEINNKQETYDNICMENGKYLELESLLKENISILCKKLGIENV